MSPVESRRSWVRRYIVAAPAALPLYGSEAWLAMPDGRDKWIAVLRFAEGARSDLEDGLDRLRVEHLGAALEAKRSEDRAYVEQRDQWRREYGQKSYRPHPANRRGAA